jgi:maltose alpha-D-glucosyltransferase/alpha-amylase
MLFQAEALARHYAPIVSKQPPPSLTPQTDQLLRRSSNWLIIDLAQIKTEGASPFASLDNESLWECLSAIGFDGVEWKGLKGPPDAPVSLQIDRKMGTESEYASLASKALSKGMNFVGSIVGGSTGNGIDFALALKNIGSYPGLYSLIEIPEADWGLLPEVKRNSISANIPWLTLQKLAKKGYVPGLSDPYVKQSDWNATEPIRCADQNLRRWIYLRDALGHPRLNWLNPSFASERLAAGDVLQSIYRFGEPILQLDAGLPESVGETLSLLIRKLKGFSAAFCKGGVLSFSKKTADLLYDHLTPMAALHALIAEDAQMLRLTAQMLLEGNVQPKRLIHSLEPFGRAPCDWAELLSSPRKKYQYSQVEWTGEALRTRLLREDKERLAGLSAPLSWINACSSCTFEMEDLNRKREQIQELHLLLVKFFAWQPGAFSLSAADLVGASGHFNLLEPSDTLYASIPVQLQNSKSFASHLQRILRTRRDLSLERAELIDVPPVENKGLLIFRYRVLETGYPALLAVNFSKTKVSEILESSEYVRTSAIDLYTGKSIAKTHDSSFFIVNADPYTAHLILFQPKISR